MERSRAEPLQGVSAVGSFCVAAFFGQGSPAAFFFSNTLMAVCSRSMPFLASAIALSQPLVHLLNLCVDICLSPRLRLVYGKPDVQRSLRSCRKGIGVPPRKARDRRGAHSFLEKNDERSGDAHRPVRRKRHRLLGLCWRTTSTTRR